MIRRPPRSTQSRSSAASDVYKRQGLDMGQAVYTAGTRPVGPQVTTLGHLSTPHLSVGMAIRPAQVNPSLVPSLVPTSVVGSTLSTSVVPTFAMPAPSTSIATAMPPASMVADTRPTYVSLGVPLTSVSPLVSATAVPSVVMTASAPPPSLPPVSQDCLLYTSPSPRDGLLSRMPSSA